MAKELIGLSWIEDLLPEDFRRKAMFGGFGYYMDDLMILAMFESAKPDRIYKGKKFKFELWNGCLFPVEKGIQSHVIQIFPLLFPHPILSKWLYLPAETEDFESHVEVIMKRLRQEVSKNSGLFGVIPERKKKAAVKKEKDPLAGIDYRKMDTRRPKMFADEPLEEKLKTATKISDLKNLGPQAEKHFKKAGIKSVKAFVKMGWQKAFTKLAKSDPKLRHTLYAYALIAALKNTDWSNLTEKEKAEAKALNAALKPKKKK